MNKLREIIYHRVQIPYSERRLNDFIGETKRRAHEGRHVSVVVRLQREWVAPLDAIRDFDRDEVRARLTAIEGAGETAVRRSTKNLLVEVVPRHAGNAFGVFDRAVRRAQKGQPTDFQMTGQWIDDISGIGDAVNNSRRMARYRDRFQAIFADEPNIQVDIAEVDRDGRVVPFTEFN